MVLYHGLRVHDLSGGCSGTSFFILIKTVYRATHRQSSRSIIGQFDLAKTFDFYIKKLRPNEKEWLGKYILLKPKKDEIKIAYKITSESTDGNLSGELTCRLENE